MDRMLKLGVAALLMAAGTAGAQEVTKPATADTQAAQKQAAGVVKTADSRAHSPFWIWNDYMASLNAIRGAEAPEVVRTNAEQEAVIIKANREFRSELAEFLRTNKTELATLRAKLGDHNTNGVTAEKQLVDMGKEGGVPPKKMAEQIDEIGENVEVLEPNSPEFKETLTRFRTIMREAPDVASFKERVDKVLNDEQRVEIARRAKILANARPRVDNNSPMQQQMEAAVNNYNINNPEIPQRIRDRWATMSTGQRFKAIRDIERRLKLNGGVWDKVATPDSKSQATVPTAPAADPR